ncbi:MAG: MarR family transcriptional regulator, partial [Gammaproteobacteria bacterium]|nr:MarR family transcriptional regulator [Gammaproteobacteria bacterium]
MPNTKTNPQLRDSIKALLRDSLAWIESEQLKLLQDSPYEGASNAEIKLFAALRGTSRSISELSRYLGISRQAVHQTVHKLVERGIVKLQPAESNQREKHVVITEKGREVQRMTAEHFRTIESKMAANIGRKNVELLR